MNATVPEVVETPAAVMEWPVSDETEIAAEPDEDELPDAVMICLMRITMEPADVEVPAPVMPRICNGFRAAEPEEVEAPEAVSRYLTRRIADPDDVDTAAAVRPELTDSISNVEG